VSVVIDASAVVAVLVDTGPKGRWVEGVIAANALAAPHLMPVEVANVLRRTVSARQISADVGALAHASLLGLPVELFAYEVHAGRVWELRSNLTCYDAWYVALAEALDVPLVTLDRRLAASAGPRCTFLQPG
jgi:predicted nucleic acid-binding protein